MNDEPLIEEATTDNRRSSKDAKRGKRAKNTASKPLCHIDRNGHDIEAAKREPKYRRRCVHGLIAPTYIPPSQAASESLTLHHLLDLEQPVIVVKSMFRHLF